MKKPNSIKNREKTIFEKINYHGGKIRVKAKKDEVLLEIEKVSKPVMVPIMFSDYPNSYIVEETNKKVVFKIA